METVDVKLVLDLVYIVTIKFVSVVTSLALVCTHQLVKEFPFMSNNC